MNMTLRRDLDLKKAYDMISWKQDYPFQIADFMSIDLDKNVETLSRDLRKDFIDKGHISG